MKKIVGVIIVAGVAALGWHLSTGSKKVATDRVMSQDTSYSPANEQVLKVSNGTEPKELDPTTCTGVPESHIVDNIFEGLTSLDPYTLEPVPGVAESWSISGDGLVYTFKLRKDSKWSDGTPLTARDFVWSWQRTLSPETASEYAYQLYYLKNGRSINQGQTADPNLLGAKAVDSHTLKVTLENPTPYFLRLTSFHTLFPVPRHVIEKYPEDKEWTRAGNLVSNGPFKLTEWELNTHVKIEPNEHYWDRGMVKLQAIYYYPIENQNTEEKTFMAGDLHMTSSVPTMKVDTYKAQIKRDPNKYHPYKSNPYLGTYYYRFNVTKKPFNDPRVRRAFAMTVDRKMLVERVLRGGQDPAVTFTPPGIGGYTFENPDLPVSVTPAIIAKAKGLLAEAGYPEGRGMPKIEILYNTNEGHKKIAIAIQQMWKQNLGIDVGMYNQEWKVYLNTQRQLDYEISRAGWIGDYDDPNTFLDMYVTDGGNNQTGWANPEYDKLIRTAGETVDPQERHRIFQEAESLLLTELPVLPIYTYTRQTLIAKALKMFKRDGTITEWQPNITDRWIFKHYVLVDTGSQSTRNG